LNQTFGMDYNDEYFFIGNPAEARRYNFTKNQIKLEGVGEKIADLPSTYHVTRDVRVSPDGKYLYVGVGSGANVEIEPLPRASVMTMNFDGTDKKNFASGLRNPNGLDFHPKTQELYLVVNERDGLGDDLVPDYFTRIQNGSFYGWPYAYLSPNLLDPRELNATTGASLNASVAVTTVTPDVLFEAHSAPLGMKFYTGTTFPQKYRNGAFASNHGSWNRNQPAGYKIVFIPFDENNRPTGSYEDFITGFIIDPSVPSVWGRPVSLLVLQDGSILFTDDGNGRIYRVQYAPAGCSSQ